MCPKRRFLFWTWTAHKGPWKQVSYSRQFGSYDPVYADFQCGACGEEVEGVVSAP